MKCLAVALILLGGCLDTASCLTHERFTVSRKSTTTHHEPKYSDSLRPLGTQHSTRRNAIYARDTEALAIGLFPRGSGGSPEHTPPASGRSSPAPNLPANVATVTSGQQQAQRPSENYIRLQRPGAMTPRRLPNLRRIRIKTAGVDSMRGQFETLLKPNVNRKPQSARDGAGTPPRLMERVSSANSLASSSSSSTMSDTSLSRILSSRLSDAPKAPQSPKSPKQSPRPSSPNTMLNKELDWLAKEKWSANRLPFEGNPHGMTGQYVKEAGIYDPSSGRQPGDPYAAGPRSHVPSSSSSSSGLSTSSTSPNRVQIAPLPQHHREQQQQQQPDLLNLSPWIYNPSYFPSFW